EGYRRLQQACYDTARWLSDEIGKLGPFEFLNSGDPEQGIPSVCFKFQDGADPGYSLYDLSAKVLERGWQVPAFSLPVNTEDVDVIRIMIRQGVSRDLASLLVGDLERAIDHFERHPVSVPMTERERGSFKHT
ncbi:MAG: glutamate decarboxylase, partial [Myxococcota bacterium]